MTPRRLPTCSCSTPVACCATEARPMRTTKIRPRTPLTCAVRSMRCSLSGSPIRRKPRRWAARSSGSRALSRSTRASHDPVGNRSNCTVDRQREHGERVTSEALRSSGEACPAAKSPGALRQRWVALTLLAGAWISVDIHTMLGGAPLSLEPLERLVVRHAEVESNAFAGDAVRDHVPVQGVIGPQRQSPWVTCVIHQLHRAGDVVKHAPSNYGTVLLYGHEPPVSSQSGSRFSQLLQPAWKRTMATNRQQVQAIPFAQLPVGLCLLYHQARLLRLEDVAVEVHTRSLVAVEQFLR